MGIDQLGFQSIQLGYLKILQMGNADPNNTKAGKEYECINWGNHRSVIFRLVSHHSSVVFRHNKSVGHHSDDSVVPFRHDTSVFRSPRGSISGSQSINGLNMKVPLEDLMDTGLLQNTQSLSLAQSELLATPQSQVQTQLLVLQVNEIFRLALRSTFVTDSNDITMNTIL
ncbi:hypothetical protein F511_27679 [Dorcoceras hygrometricum]|uniref:Uncharacterized protein n=1 Tax=Dorcoceras hygrometricum TaxID=472368 RepID=A0A2Z7B1I5_9LAMI|nr:hypothetical protein F511_27679 [Dorcoceras hygrometricum]